MHLTVRGTHPPGRSQLPGVKVELLVEAEPMVLGADIPAVLANITRLMGAGTDPVAVLVSDPSSVLDMQQLGLPSAIDIGDGNIVQ